jgi:hypothetical protein
MRSLRRADVRKVEVCAPPPQARLAVARAVSLCSALQRWPVPALARAGAGPYRRWPVPALARPVSDAVLLCGGPTHASADLGNAVRQADLVATDAHGAKPAKAAGLAGAADASENRKSANAAATPSRGDGVMTAVATDARLSKVGAAKLAISLAAETTRADEAAAAHFHARSNSISSSGSTVGSAAAHLSPGGSLALA